VWWTTAAEMPKKSKKKWRDDLIEDYLNADKETKERMVALYGEPRL
jgi:hypothetical protein